MRLLKRKLDGSFELVTFSNASDLPPYATLSHTWIDGKEVTYDELVAGTGNDKAGYAKIRFCGEQAAQDGLQFFWVDTCCIDKSNRAELQESIASMFHWYRRAEKCYVYLSDVFTKKRKREEENMQHSQEKAFRKSRWFTRGWTLQELLAPSAVEFFSAEGSRIGDKQSLEQEIHKITGLPVSALRGNNLYQFGVKERLSWTEPRQTTLEEDLAYSLLGIFDVSIPLRYGEGKVSAFERLEEEINKLEKCIQDLHITDPRDDKKRIEETKGGLLESSYQWILETPDFQQWYNAQHDKLLWIKGDPGKGKTMLLCGVINELESSAANMVFLSYFFCQATDSRLNSATAVLRGLIYMLLGQQPSLMSHIRNKYDQAGKTIFDDLNAWVALSEIFTNILRDPSLNKTYIVIDALDECSIGLPKLLGFIARHSTLSSCVKWIVSSRNWPEIEEHLEQGGQKIRLCLELNTKSISTAVSNYIQHKVNNLAKRKKYNDKTKDAILQYLSHNADNTFLWVALVCQNLERIPRWNTINRLNVFPPGLDSLYERMLEQIRDSDSKDLCTQTLATLAVVYRPIALNELICLVDAPENIFDDTESIIDLIHLCGSFLTIRGGTIYFVHQSAKDFLLRKAFNEIFPSGIENVHHTVLLKSIHTLSRTLRRDIYSLRALGYPVERVKPPDPDPLATSRYACVFWTEHLCNWIPGINDHESDLLEGGVIETFIKHKYLYWLEALSLCRNLSEGVRSIGKLEAILQARAEAPGFLKLVQDARRFVLYNKLAIENSPLQTYVSALLFSPSRSLIRGLFKHEEPNWITLKPIMDDKWSPCLQTLEGHDEAVFSVIYSHDSTRLASASADCTVNIWDAGRGGECLKTLEGHEESICSVAFSHDSARLASCSVDKSIKIWDVDNGECLQTLEGHSDSVLSVAFSHNSALLASASHDSTIKIWDMDKNEYLHSLNDHSDSVWCIAFSHDSSHLASASGDKTVRLWNTDIGECLHTLQGHSDSVSSVAFSRNSTWLASASADCTVIIWDSATGKLHRILEGNSEMSSIAFSHDSSQLVSASRDHIIRIWDTGTGKCLQRLEGHADWVSSVAFSHDSTQVASASHDHTVKIWEPGTGGYLQVPKAHTNHISSISFSHDSTQVASASKDGIIKTWRAGSGRCLHMFEGHHDRVSSVVFSHDLTLLASSSEDYTVRLWSVDSGECLQKLEGHKEEVWSVAFSHNSAQLASSSRDRTVKVWDVGSGKCLQTFKCYGSWICSVAFSHDSTWLASGDFSVTIWKTNNGECLKTLQGHNESIWSIAFSHDSTRLASASARGIVNIWDVGRAFCLQTINVGITLYDIKFNSTSSYLLTDLGTIYMHTPLPLGQTTNANNIRKAVYHGGGLSTDFNWITYNSENIVWLPADYRPLRSATSESVLAVGAKSGNVWICHFDLDNNDF